jgi:hypothetical protein
MKYQVISILFHSPKYDIVSESHFSNVSWFIYSKDENGHIFFDRNPRVFEVILDFYRTGKLIRSPDIPLELLKEELDFFQLNIAEDSDHKRLSMELMKLEYRSSLKTTTSIKKSKIRVCKENKMN